MVRDEYNRHMRTEFEQVRDFIILHFSATERDDTPVLELLPDDEHSRHACGTRSNCSATAARVFRYEEELFSKPSWVAVLLGQNIVPKQCDPIVASLPHADGARKPGVDAPRDGPGGQGHADARGIHPPLLSVAERVPDAS